MNTINIFVKVLSFSFVNSPYIFPVGDSPELVCSVAAVLAIFQSWKLMMLRSLNLSKSYTSTYFTVYPTKFEITEMLFSTFTENICEEFLRKNRFLISASDGIGFFFSRFESPPNVTIF